MPKAAPRWSSGSAKARQIRSSTDFYSALGEVRPGTDTVMLVFRGQASYYVTVPF